MHFGEKKCDWFNLVKGAILCIIDEILILDETENRAIFFCRHYSPFHSFSLPLRKRGIE